MVQAGQQLQVLAAHPFFAAIAGMALKGELSVRQPAAQGFGVNGKLPTTVSQRQQSHGATPFVLLVTWTITSPRTCQGEVLGDFQGRVPRDAQGGVLGDFQGKQTSGLTEAATRRQVGDRLGAEGFLAAPTMIIAGPILMGSPPPRPVTDQRRAGGSGPDQTGQQVTNF